MRFLKIKEVAERLQLSPFTVRSLIKAGKIPVIRLGHRTIRIPDTWLESLAKSETESEIEHETEEPKM